MMEDIIVVILLLLILGGVLIYLCRAKKRGDTCIGCPYAKQCSGKNGSACDGHPPQS